MLIPVAVRHLDEPDAGLGEATRHQALASEILGGAVADTVTLERGPAFIPDIHQLRHGRLHAEREFVRLDDALDLRALFFALEQVAVQRLDKVELLTLQLPGDLLVVEVAQRSGADVLVELPNLGALIKRRQKGAAVILRAADVVRRAERDEAGEVLILGAQAVQYPGAHRRPHELEATGVQLQKTLGMRRYGGVHAVKQAEVVGVFGQAREQLGNSQAALTVLLEFPRRRHEFAVAKLGQLLALVAGERRFVVECVNVRRAAAHAAEDHALGLGQKVRAPGGERPVGRGLCGAHPGKGHVAEAGRETAEHVAARQQIAVVTAVAIVPVVHRSVFVWCEAALGQARLVCQSI